MNLASLAISLGWIDLLPGGGGSAEADAGSRTDVELAIDTKESTSKLCSWMIALVAGYEKRDDLKG